MSTSALTPPPPADEGDAGVRRFLREVVTQWRSLSMEVRSVRSMLEEVLSNWEKYSSTVASLQAWLEDAEEALDKPENVRRVREGWLSTPFDLDPISSPHPTARMISQTYSESPWVFQLSRRHGYRRFPSPPRIRQLITPVLSPSLFLSFNTSLCFFIM